MSGNRDEALYMGRRDRFRDWFRPQKKAEVLKVFWDLMHPEQNNGTPAAAGSCEEWVGALYAFHKLMDLADESSRGLFDIRVTTKRLVGNDYVINADFLVKGESVRKTSYLSHGRADLSRANLSGVDLSDVDLSDVDLTHADLNHANLTGARLSHADLRDADMRGANLTGAHLGDADLFSAWLHGATYGGVLLTPENLRWYLKDTSSLRFPRNMDNICWEAGPDGRDVQMTV